MRWETKRVRCSSSFLIRMIRLIFSCRFAIHSFSICFAKRQMTYTADACPCMCANIGQIPNLEKLMATIRSREISACLVLQTQSQLKAQYKDSADTICGNCDSVIFLGGKEKATLKELSKALGRETIDTLNTGESRGRETSRSTNFQKLGKELMSVDELAVMDGRKCVLQLRGVRPFLSDKYDITQHPNYKYLSDADPRNAFYIERFLKRRMKLKSDEQYDVFEVNVSDADE